MFYTYFKVSQKICCDKLRNYGTLELQLKSSVMILKSYASNNLTILRIFHLQRGRDFIESFFSIFLAYLLGCQSKSPFLA